MRIKNILTLLTNTQKAKENSVKNRSPKGQERRKLQAKKIEEKNCAGDSLKHKATRDIYLYKNQTGQKFKHLKLN